MVFQVNPLLMHAIKKSSAVEVLVMRRLDQDLLCKPVPSQLRETYAKITWVPFTNMDQLKSRHASYAQ